MARPKYQQVDQGTFAAGATIEGSSNPPMASNDTTFAPLADRNQNSYPVSPDVGKVGNESPTFIEPIAERKDGIVAMFANQGSRTSKPSSPVKRKRSISPLPTKNPRSKIAKEESVEFLGFGKSNSEVRGN